MSEEIKKQDQPKEPAKAGELEEQDMDEVSGGCTKDVEGIDIIVRKKTNTAALTPTSGNAK